MVCWNFAKITHSLLPDTVYRFCFIYSGYYNTRTIFAAFGFQLVCALPLENIKFMKSYFGQRKHTLCNYFGGCTRTGKAAYIKSF